MKYSSLILHIPHSGTHFSGARSQHTEILVDNAKDIIDWYTDELFVPENPCNAIIPLVFPMCRTECDVERLVDDPLEAENLGISYDSDPLGPQHGFFNVDGTIIRPDTNLARLMYDAFHINVWMRLSQNPNPLLIDCHSFSSRPNALLTDAEMCTKYDICIGYNDDATCPDVDTIELVRRHFESFGYSVGINEPFSNAKTFDYSGEYHSIMIELNKRLYMNEDTLERNGNFDTLRRQIGELYSKLIS